ncbi:hypothetical protein A5765_16170 [Mycolicibacterium celeriflavum]|uniref:Uncharacterized protein n=1 Tax=Mycolicibacterium celeriflavum TaxID=1249101 RepID=A0A1X0BYV4_MYCCF|nr:DUF6480 family protein [Mycolicibacterium celeriflavum]MCV7236866.1 hypothetical protein [Mycolicibacterium celeriflavum]OBG11843.1 hypothetical protein A5765_16170 [Mycolicibacterium celeriflavum]ORA49495.1 hypothetical protein BST21_06375 [Mycolicibacterium celeriflavum]BBY43887.1 hypothetical protein MCEL_21820 [Mycolicibacterium celeriflavum]
MTAIPPDPDPADTPDLEPGGGVPPGSTPPDSDQTSGVGAVESRPRHRWTPTAVASIIAVALFVLLFLAAAVWLIVG